MSVEIPGDAPRVGRKSLRPEQIRDPLATLATAYGVERDLLAVAFAITQRLPTDLGPADLDVRYRAVVGIVSGLVRDGRNLGRIYRGSPLAKPARTMMMTSTAFPVGSLAPEQFVAMVCREIRSVLD